MPPGGGGEGNNARVVRGSMPSEVDERIDAQGE